VTTAQANVINFDSELVAVYYRLASVMVKMISCGIFIISNVLRSTWSLARDDSNT
jgi:hypothetical protein